MYSEPAVAVPCSGDRRSPNSFEIWVGVVGSASVAVNVCTEHVGNAVAFAAAQVTGDKHVGTGCGFVCREAHLFEDGLCAGSGFFFCDEDFVFFRYEEVLEHFWKVVFWGDE